MLECWFGLGQKGEKFEKEFSQYLGLKYGCLVNSGSSANLLALNAINIDRGLKGGEVITPACVFPTTLNPIIQLGFKPAFVDVDNTLNINPEAVRQAINEKLSGFFLLIPWGIRQKLIKLKSLQMNMIYFLLKAAVMHTVQNIVVIIVALTEIVLHLAFTPHTA